MQGPESSAEEAESLAAMTARVRASFERQGMMTTLGVQLAAVERGRVELIIDHDDRATRPFAIMQATLSAVYDRPGITH